MTRKTAEHPAAVISFSVPDIPPSVNRYVRHVRTKSGALRHYRTERANGFMFLMGIAAAGRKIRADAYRVEIAVYLGKKDRGDLDNFAKVVLDGLVATAVIDTDAAVTELVMYKFRDRDNRRTEIVVGRDAQMQGWEKE